MMPTTQKLISEGFEQVTGLSSAKALTVPKGARYAVISVSAQSVRYRDDGTDPDTSTGVILTVANGPYFFSTHLQNLRFFEDAASAVLDVAYYS